MNIKEKIYKLMINSGINSYKELLIKIYQQIGDKAVAYEKAEKEKGNFTKMLKGERELNSKYYVPLEKIFNIRIADILCDDDFVKPSFRNRGLRYTAATNSYKEFENLGVETINNEELVIFNTDEYNKSIFDYIIEYRANSGIKYLVDNFSLKYECLRAMFFSPNARCFCYGNNIDKIADVLFEVDDGETFTRLFYAYDMLQYEERCIYSNEEFLKKILNSNNVFHKYLTKKELYLSEINYHQNNDQKGVYINPILNKLLEVAFDDPKKYADKIIDILDYGIDNNRKVLVVAEQFDETGTQIFSIKENGSIMMNYNIYGCVIVLKDKYINPDITSEIRSKMMRIREINNQILVRETREIMGMKRLQKNKDGNVIKLHTDNNVEYEMYEKLKGKELPIPVLLRTRDGVDEFSAYIGHNTYDKYSDSMIVDMVKFIKNLHVESLKIFNDKVYVHGNICAENFYFVKNKLTCVANWDDCHIGETYEDLGGLILNFSNVVDRYRNNSDVFDKIELIFETYEADKKTKTLVIDYLIKFIIEKVKNLDLQDEQDIEIYETLKWCEIFFDVYAQQLKVL